MRPTFNQLCSKVLAIKGFPATVAEMCFNNTIWTAQTLVIGNHYQEIVNVLRLFHIRNIKWIPLSGAQNTRQIQLEQLERLRSQIHRRPMIAHTGDSHQIPSQNKTKSKLKNAKNSNFEYLQLTLPPTYLPEINFPFKARQHDVYLETIPCIWDYNLIIRASTVKWAS